MIPIEISAETRFLKEKDEFLNYCGVNSNHKSIDFCLVYRQIVNGNSSFIPPFKIVLGAEGPLIKGVMEKRKENTRKNLN